MAANRAHPPISPEGQQMLRDKVVPLVRAILLAAKDGILVENVNRESRATIGEPIPWRRMGYASIDDFLNQNTHMCRIQRKADGYNYAVGVATTDNAHIAKMVSRQKPTKKRAKPSPARSPRLSYHQWSPPVDGLHRFPSQGRSTTGARYAGGSGRFTAGSQAGAMPMQQKYRFGQGNQQQPTQRLRSPHNGVVGGNDSQQQSGQGSRSMEARYFQQPNATSISRSNQPTNRNSSGSNRANGSKNGLAKSPNSNQPAGDASRQLLREYFKIHSLGELSFKTAIMESRTGGNSGGKGGGQKLKTVKRYVSTVKIRAESCLTYPETYATEEMAEEAASKLACLKLGISKLSLTSSGSSPSDVSTSDNDFGTWTNGTAEKAGVLSVSDFDVDRIVDLVGTRTNGVWSTQIEVEYSRKFKGEKLPDKWPDKLEASGYGTIKLRVDRPIAGSGRCIILPNLELLAAAAAAGDATSASSTASAANLPETVPFQDLSISEDALSAAQAKAPLSSPMAATSQPRPPVLILPEEELWNVYITCVHSTVNVCVRILGDAFSAKFDDLVTDMELNYFESDEIPPVTLPVVVGRLYAAKFESDWHRVEVTSIKGSEITCYFIDHGDEEIVGIEQLREIDPKFLDLATQAKHVRLARLEEFKDDPEAQTELTNLALGRSLVGKVYSNDGNGVSLVLLDTSGDDKDVNLNKALLDKLQGSVMLASDSNGSASSGPPPLEVPFNSSTSTPPLMNGGGDARPEEREESPTSIAELMDVDLSSLKSLVPMMRPNVDSFFDVTVTLAASPSNFTVQSYAEEKNLKELEAAMKKFYNDESLRYGEPLTSVHLGKDSFFAGKTSDSVWRRVKVNSLLDENNVAVKIVDYGDFSVMSLDEMQPLWPQFRNLPMQAINASFADIVAANGDWTPSDTVWFTQRVVGKQFVSKIKDVSQDLNAADGSSYKLSVSMFDTSNPEHDILVDKELVDLGRAAYLCV